MATLLTETPSRTMRKKLTQQQQHQQQQQPTSGEVLSSARRQPQKRKSASEQNNNVKRARVSAADGREDMLAAYQPWVIQTYGDLAKTKTVTLRKYARILRTLRGEEAVSADNSKFRFWVKAKGFHEGKPYAYEPKPADAIVGRYSVCDMDAGIRPVGDKASGSAKDPPLYVPTAAHAPFKNSTGEPVYRKVAVVENFFDIIYNVHVELEGRPGKHAGQKRTYRTITETYAFLPREAVTRFLLGCTECQKHPRSPSPVVSVLPTPSPSPTLPSAPLTLNHAERQPQPPPPENHPKRDLPKDETAAPKTPPPPCGHPLDVRNLTSGGEDATTPRTPTPSLPKKRPQLSPPSTPLRQHAPPPKLWSPVEGIEREERERRRCFMPKEIDYTLPITTTYLKYMRTLGCTDDEALKLESRHVSTIVERFLQDMITDYFK